MPRNVPRAAWKLLERMRASQAGWGEDDLETLYKGFGFSSREGNHRVYYHTDYPELRPAPVGRHRQLARGYADTALKRVQHVIDAEKLTPENSR